MTFEVRVSGWAPPSGFHERIERRVQAVLGRFQDQVRSVRVFLADANGSKGGVDQICRCVIRMSRQATIVIEDRDSRLGRLVDRVAQRAKQALGRQATRSRMR